MVVVSRFVVVFESFTVVRDTSVVVTMTVEVDVLPSFWRRCNFEALRSVQCLASVGEIGRLSSSRGWRLPPKINPLHKTTKVLAKAPEGKSLLAFTRVGVADSASGVRAGTCRFTTSVVVTYVTSVWVP